jgi:hypothetical protein
MATSDCTNWEKIKPTHEKTPPGFWADGVLLLNLFRAALMPMTQNCLIRQPFCLTNETVENQQRI